MPHALQLLDARYESAGISHDRAKTVPLAELIECRTVYKNLSVCRMFSQQIQQCPLIKRWQRRCNGKKGKRHDRPANDHSSAQTVSEPPLTNQPRAHSNDQNKN